MTTRINENAREKIRELLKNITAAWINGCPEDLEKYFFEDMAIIQSNLQPLGEGRESCIDSYLDFLEQAKILEYRESDHKILLWGDTALAGYSFEIRYEMNHQIYHESGRDVFGFLCRDRKWGAVWRMLPGAKDES
ncbi:MAG: nuclear transport factor 2 family protein [Calditrichia bacterium]